LRAKHADAVVPTFRSAPLPRGVTLPAGSVQYVLELPPPPDSLIMPVMPAPPHSKAKPAKPLPRKGLAFHLIVAPDGQRTWAGIAGDETLAATRMLASMGTTGDKLGSRADLGSLKQNASLGSAGFLTLRGLGGVLAMIAMSVGDSPSEISSVYEESLQLPHQALSPIPFSFTPQAGNPGSFVSTFTISKGSIEDFVTTVVKHGGF
jgi:hypothetical protein